MPIPPFHNILAGVSLALAAVVQNFEIDIRNSDFVISTILLSS